jgi:hypothetical protein
MISMNLGSAIKLDQNLNKHFSYVLDLDLYPSSQHKGVI